MRGNEDGEPAAAADRRPAGGDDPAVFYGARSVELVRRLHQAGVGRIALLARHSVRTFNREIHDLANPLTDEGREHCRRFGEALPKALAVRGYASPPERCMETAKLVIQAHGSRGGKAGGTRPVESLGVFYALDQIRMWKTLQSSDGLSGFVARWTAGDVPADAMIPADDAARLILRACLVRLRGGGERDHLDLCVTHDMTILLLRDRLLGEAAALHQVDFLEALALYEDQGRVWLQSTRGPAVDVGSLAG